MEKRTIKLAGTSLLWTETEARALRPIIQSRTIDMITEAIQQNPDEVSDSQVIDDITSILNENGYKVESPYSNTK